MNRNEENKTCITITLDEYKELLIIKGKYEELSKKANTITYIPYKEPNINPLRTNPIWISGTEKTYSNDNVSYKTRCERNKHD